MQPKQQPAGEERSDRDSEAFENIRQINRELFVASMADIDEQAASDLQHARRYVLAALELIRPRKLAVGVPVEHLPVDEFAALLARRQAKFDPLFRVVQSSPPKGAAMPPKLNGRRNRRHYGCF